MKKRNLKTMYKDLPSLFNDVSQLKNPMRSVIASHIWWSKCNRIPEISMMKKFIDYNMNDSSADEVHKYLVKFGYSKVYADRALKSTRVWEQIKKENKAK